MGYYDVGQVCVNGHAVTGNVRRSPQFSEKFCSKCGAETVTQCGHCRAAIRGEYEVDGAAVIGFAYLPPSYCHECGVPYPWRAKEIEAAEELIDLADHLTDSERAALKADLSSLTVQSPRTEVAIVRMRQFLTRAKNEAGPAMRTLLTSIATDAVKKSLGL